MRTLIKNAKIYDGTGSAPFKGDILIAGDRIEKVGTKIEAEAERVIDLQGRSLSSAFIDAHSHNDWFAIKNDPLPYFAPFIRQGIGTFVAGNCGVSAIGFEPGCKYTDKLGGGLFDFKDTTGKYGTVDELFAAVDGKMPGNMLVLAGHCSARAAAGGNENRPLTAEEESTMLSPAESLKGACISPSWSPLSLPERNITAELWGVSAMLGRRYFSGSAGSSER